MRRLIVTVGAMVVAGVVIVLLSPKHDDAYETRPGRTIQQTLSATPIPTGSLRYFQRQLIRDGDNASGTFGGELASLGLRGRELQAMPIAEAFALAHSKALSISDVPTRRRYLLDLFAETED